MSGTPLLIGLSGKKRMGKDTLASFLIAEHGFTRFAFADALKQACLDINPTVVHANGRDWSRLQGVFAEYGSFEAIKTSPWDASVRDLLQQVGSVMALRDNTIWAGPVVKAAAEHVRTTGQGAVITDVRFPWESDLVWGNGGVMVRVMRSDLPDHTQTDTHISETMLDTLVPNSYFDTTPLNSGFRERVSDLMEVLSVSALAQNWQSSASETSSMGRV